MAEMFDQKSDAQRGVTSIPVPGERINRDVPQTLRSAARVTERDGQSLNASSRYRRILRSFNQLLSEFSGRVIHRFDFGWSQQSNRARRDFRRPFAICQTINGRQFGSPFRQCFGDVPSILRQTKNGFRRRLPGNHTTNHIVRRTPVDKNQISLRVARHEAQPPCIFQSINFTQPGEQHSPQLDPLWLVGNY